MRRGEEGVSRGRRENEGNEREIGTVFLTSEEFSGQKLGGFFFSPVTKSWVILS